MKKLKVLNLYACLGGNRLKWDNSLIDVTAVELDPYLAECYKKRFPNDTVIVGDAHQYLLDHYKEFDFIWSSPPCPTHSKINISMKTKRKMNYPDMKLYQEIIFLESFFDGKYCVENVDPYYKPLIPAKKRGRHLFWSNFSIPNFKANDAVIRQYQIKDLEAHHGIDLSQYKGSQNRRKIGRNLVHFETGRIIFNAAYGIIQAQKDNQISMF